MRQFKKVTEWMYSIGLLILGFLLKNIIAVALCVISGLIFLYAYAVTGPITYFELRLLIGFFFALSVVLTFSVLRLYNAVVKNTLFLFKLRGAITVLKSGLTATIKSLRDLGVHMDHLKRKINAKDS